MQLVPAAKEHGLIDNKTCSIDAGRSGIRFVVPRARELGMIDNKTCSIDAERSGIRLVIPRSLRGGARLAELDEDE